MIGSPRYTPNPRQTVAIPVAFQVQSPEGRPQLIWEAPEGKRINAVVCEIQFL